MMHHNNKTKTEYHVKLVFPENRDIEISQFLSSWTKLDDLGLLPFSEEAIELCGAFSKALLTCPERQSHPELAALGFWMRKSVLWRLKEEYASINTLPIMSKPVGTVFHLPPANVDTMFVYSWMISLLCGNRNIVRLPRKMSPTTETIIDLINQLLHHDDNGLINGGTVLLTYGHEKSITEAISSVSGLRVIWGGDIAVASIRNAVLPAHAKEIAFPDRYSFASLKASVFLDLEASERKKILQRFFNDSYWFNQMACSSPRMIVWCGDKDVCRRASARFFSELREVAMRQGYISDSGTALKKISFSHNAILDMPIVEYCYYGDELTTLTLDSLSPFQRKHCGGGLFFEFYCADLFDLVEFITVKDQTMVHFGFEAKEVTEFARSVGSRGLSRILPIGRALTFSHLWDGLDLLREMTRVTQVEI